jgi:hypothetical protein
MCNFKIRGVNNINSIFDLYIIYYNKEMLFATVAAIYVILQTAIPDYPVKGVGHERETRVHFTISDFYNDEYIKPKQQYTTPSNSKANTSNNNDNNDKNKNKTQYTHGDNNDSEDAEIGNLQIVTLFTKMLTDGKQQNSVVSFGSLLTGIVKMTESQIQDKLSDMINDFKSGNHEDINVLYETKQEYRINLAEEMRDMSYNLKDWHTFKPTYIEEDQNTIGNIKHIISNVHDKLKKYDTTSNNVDVSLAAAKFDNYYFSVTLLKLINEYISRSDKLVGTEFLHNSVNLTPVKSLVNKYAFYTFSLLREPEYLDFNLLLPQYKQTIVSLISTTSKLDHNIDEQSLDYILNPLPYSTPYKHKLMEYFRFQTVLTSHLSLNDKLNYYSDALKDILLSFDIMIDIDDIKGTGKKREYIRILSNDRFDIFLADMYEIKREKIDSDSDIDNNDLEKGNERFMFSGEETGELIDIRKVAHCEQAKLLIHKWNVPYNKKVTEDNCGNKSQINYLDIANEHLTKIDVLSGKNSLELYKETTEYIEQLGKNINVYEELLNNLLKYINRNNLELFNGKHMKRIPDDPDLALYKKDIKQHTTDNSIDYPKMITLFHKCIHNLNGHGKLTNNTLYGNYISKLLNIHKYYTNLSYIHPDNLGDDVRNLWYSQNITQSGITQISEDIKRKIIDSLEIRDENIINMFNLDFQRNDKIYEAKVTIENILSMNGLSNDMLIPITLLPKTREIITPTKLISNRTQKVINSEILIEREKQQNNKEHALSILKYLQIFHHHMCIIKNEHRDQQLYHTTRGWNKFEINQTYYNQENEFGPFFEIIDRNDTAIRKFKDILIRLFGENQIKEDRPLINIPQIVSILSSLQFQVETDVSLLLPYDKIFTGEHYYELTKGIFYSVIFKIIEEIEDIGSNVKDNVMDLFRELMVIILNKINNMYEYDIKTDEDIQDELDKQKGLQNQLRKKQFDQMNPSERVLYAFRRGQGVADVFKTVSEHQLREAELASNADFMSTENNDNYDENINLDNQEAGIFEDGHGGRDMRDGADRDILGEDDDEFDRDNF